jgi:cell division protein FtsW
MAGARFMYLVPPMVLGVIGFAVYLMNNPMTTRRIFAWLYLEEQKEGAAYQAYEAMVALGSGGVFGLGLGNGRQKLGFVPEHHTDFIYSVIGEELGLMATLLVALAYLVFLFCGLRIARRAPDTFGMLLAAGISLLIALQAAINIGVVTSALPNKGLPLPFISYGGSNLMIMLACVGILVSVARQGRTDSDLPAGVAEQREITEAYSI